MRKSIPFTWKPETWYTMKFEASNKDSKVMLRGKVWPRGEKEPAAWTVEVTDPSPHPNETGSPGIFGDAQHYRNFLRQYPGDEEREVNAR